MNETTSVSHDTIMENEYVKELFAIMSENGKDTSGLSTLLGHVSEMENFVKRAEDKISDMKLQLDSIKELQDHPIKTALQNTIKSLEERVAAVKEHLSQLKADIINGCKNAVAAFKEGGISALVNIAAFLGIRQNLQDWKKDINGIIQADEKAVAKIEAFSTEYHSAGRHLKNMARVVIGKEPLDIKKEAGILSKALAAPYKSQKSVLTSLKKKLDKAISGLEQLDNAAKAKQAQRATEKKPSLMERLEAGKEKAHQYQINAPVPERAKVQGAEI